MPPFYHYLSFWAHDLPGGPPFSTNLAEIDQLFSPRFKLSSIERPVNSAIARQGQEYLARFVAL
jgi:methyl halide transferase